MISRFLPTLFGNRQTYQKQNQSEGERPLVAVLKTVKHPSFLIALLKLVECAGELVHLVSGRPCPKILSTRFMSKINERGFVQLAHDNFTLFVTFISRAVPLIVKHGDWFAFRGADTDRVNLQAHFRSVLGGSLRIGVMVFAVR